MPGQSLPSCGPAERYIIFKGGAGRSSIKRSNQLLAKRLTFETDCKELQGDGSLHSSSAANSQSSIVVKAHWALNNQSCVYILKI